MTTIRCLLFSGAIAKIGLMFAVHSAAAGLSRG